MTETTTYPPVTACSPTRLASEPPIPALDFELLRSVDCDAAYTALAAMTPTQRCRQALAVAAFWTERGDYANALLLLRSWHRALSVRDLA
jgi:hypothetical protein